MNIKVKAYAKINLFLDIDSIRDDRYHNILSVMQSVSLCDVVNVTLTPAENRSISIRCTNPDIPCDSTNLAYRAASIYPLTSGKIDIEIDKHIPMSAGLAGGSADAAATLIALNILADKKLSEDELIALGKSLGADVPFCIVGGTYLTEGIGDVMSKFPPMPDLHIVIAKKGDGMSTPAAYSSLDEQYNNFSNYKPHSEYLNILSHNTSLKEYAQGLFNIFESVVEPYRPDVTAIKSILSSCGALGSMMSGSGTAVFGIFNNEKKARKALEELLKFGAQAHICRPCSASDRISV